LKSGRKVLNSQLKLSLTSNIMNKNQIITLVLVAVVALTSGCVGSIQSEKQVNLKNEVDSLSYFLGLNIGYQAKNMPESDQLDPALIASAINQVLKDSSVYTQDIAMNVFYELNSKIAQRESEKTLKEGIAFLENNKDREGVITTESGLQYEVLVQGDGPMPADTSMVTVHYTGSLIDGTVFDSSIEGGEPVSFPLNRVIKGWTEGLQLMSVGSKYKFYIPAALGYGPRGSGPIPGNSVLIFEVELLSID